MATRPSQSINLGLPAVPNVDNPEIYNAIYPLHSAVRNVMFALDVYTGNAYIDKAEYSEVAYNVSLLTQKTSVLFVRAFEDIGTGLFIHLFNDSGLLKARKALHPTYRAHAFVAAGGAAGEHIAVSMLGLNGNLAGLVLGTEYYLSSITAGTLGTNAANQRIGIALSSSSIWCTP